MALPAVLWILAAVVAALLSIGGCRSAPQIEEAPKAKLEDVTKAPPAPLSGFNAKPKKPGNLDPWEQKWQHDLAPPPEADTRVRELLASAERNDTQMGFAVSDEIVHTRGIVVTAREELTPVQLTPKPSFIWVRAQHR